MPTDSSRDLADEVTRVAGVSYLQGATGHSIGSLGFLLLGVVGLVVIESAAVGAGAVASASLLSANGVSIYLWDRVRDVVAETPSNEGDDDGGRARDSERTLSPPALSAEHKAELTGGLVQVVGLVTVLAVVIGTIRILGIERGSYLLGALLAAGNLVALALAWWDTDG
ncbi:MAG: hypothetical protein ABEI27_07025 [Halobellus sp.]|uniref:hypothetical protein n=1 Tax=Halobellus sp. TaxID=1979212 RepID=UPI0035D3FAA9